MARVAVQTRWSCFTPSVYYIAEKMVRALFEGRSWNHLAVTEGFEPSPIVYETIALPIELRVSFVVAELDPEPVFGVEPKGV